MEGIKLKNFYIVRHAKALGQPFNAHLTEEGKKQAENLAEFLSPFPIDRIISSPFIRAKETIEPYAKKMKLKMELDDRLGERVLITIRFPDWKEKLKESFDDFSLTFEGGESNQQGFERAKSLVEELLSSASKHIVLVSHGNLTTLLLKYFDQNYGYEHLFQLTNPDVYQVTCKDTNDFEVKRIWKA